MIPEEQTRTVSQAELHDLIVEDHLEAPPEADPASAVASRCVRTVVFFVFCQAVQCFMSYDGGATPASLDTIQEEMDGAWDPSEFGILGSIDKVGMTATSIIWGRSLQLCNVKLLLCTGLLINGLCTAAFGSLRSKWMMYLAKLLMGATQSLQGVWGTVWTVTMAPPDRKTLWLGLGGVSAGIGNGLGTAVAGFGTAQGLPYAFAFQLQAAVLMGLWVALVFTWPSRLAIKLPACDERVAAPLRTEAPRTVRETSKSSLNAEMQGNTPARRLMEKVRGPGSGSPTALEQLCALSANKVFVFTALQISLIMFQVSGIQFLWVRFFTSVWGLSKNWVTMAYLLIAGGFGGIGIAVGPAYIDRYGGYGAPPGVVASIIKLRSFARASALCGVLGLMFVYFKGADRPDIVDTTRVGGVDNWLVLLFAAVGVLHLFLQASVPALCGINMEVVHEDMRAFSSGAEMTLRNILGLAGGPLLPSLFMTVIGITQGWDSTDPDDERALLLNGMGFTLSLNVAGVFIMGRAVTEACHALEKSRELAMKSLQDAFNEQDLPALERALAVCKAVELQHVDGGLAVMTAAIEFRGAVRRRPTAAASPSRDVFVDLEGEASFELLKAHAMSKEDLCRRAVELERSLKELRETMLELQDENLSLRRRAGIAGAACDGLESLEAGGAPSGGRARGGAAPRGGGGPGPPLGAGGRCGSQQAACGGCSGPLRWLMGPCRPGEG